MKSCISDVRNSASLAGAMATKEENTALADTSAAAVKADNSCRLVGSVLIALRRFWSSAVLVHRVL